MNNLEKMKLYQSEEKKSKKKQKSGKQQELDKIFKKYGMTAAGALRERKKRNAIRKAHEKKRGH